MSSVKLQVRDLLQEVATGCGGGSLGHQTTAQQAQPAAAAAHTDTDVSEPQVRTPGRGPTGAACSSRGRHPWMQGREHTQIWQHK